MVIIRRYEKTDRAEWLRMRDALWPGLSHVEAEKDADTWLARADAVVFVAQVLQEAELRGFAEAGERTYADGCDTSPIAFLEGWFVEPSSRGQGFGAALVQAVEAWARERGYSELASDCLLENTGGQEAHEVAGFVEVERSVKYRKLLALPHTNA